MAERIEAGVSYVLDDGTVVTPRFRKMWGWLCDVGKRSGLFFDNARLSKAKRLEVEP